MKRRTQSVMITFRATPAQKEQLQLRASAAGQELGTYIKDQLSLTTSRNRNFYSQQRERILKALESPEEDDS